MAEATNSVHLARLRASIALAVNVRARQVALNAAKDQLRRQGLRLSEFSARDLRIRAVEYLAANREELIAAAKADVERWRLAGFFGRRRSNINSDAPGGKR